jgi:hypothetical protein
VSKQKRGLTTNKTGAERDSERVETRNHFKPQGKRAVARVRHAFSYGAMPSRLDMWILTVWGWSRHDLAMTWERYASVLHCFDKVFEDFGSK